MNGWQSNLDCTWMAHALVTQATGGQCRCENFVPGENPWVWAVNQNKENSVILKSKYLKETLKRQALDF